MEANGGYAGDEWRLMESITEANGVHNGGEWRLMEANGVQWDRPQ